MTCRVIEKILGRVTGGLLIVVIFSRNGCRRCCCGRQRWGEISSSCVMGGELEEGGYGKVTYVGWSSKCIVVNDGMRLEEVRSMVTEITGSDFV